MSRLRYLIASSLDGFIATSSGEFGFLLVEGPHAEEFFMTVREFDRVVLGRKTYEIALSAGNHDPYPMMETYVASRNLPDSNSDNVTILRNDVANAVRDLKQRHGKDLWLCGGGKLAGALIEAGLVDEISVKINPVLVGNGLSLASGLNSQVKLDLVSAEPYDNGVVLLTYTVAKP